MSTLEWEDATDYYLSLLVLSSPSSSTVLSINKNQLNKITLLLYEEMQGIKVIYIQARGGGGAWVCIRHPFSPPQFLQCLALHLEQIFRGKFPEQAQEQTEEPGIPTIMLQLHLGGRRGKWL